MLRMQTDDDFRKKDNSLPIQAYLLQVAGFEWNEQTYDIVTKLEDDEWARTVLYSTCGKSNGKFIGLNIGSSARHDAKRWPVENFYALASRLQKRHPKMQFLVLAGPDERLEYEKLYNLNMAEPIKNLHFIGWQQSMSQFISLVNLMDALITADTFGMHVGVALNKRIIALHGPQPENDTYLYGRGIKINLRLKCSPCFAAHFDSCRNEQKLRCMHGIDIVAVEETMDKILLMALLKQKALIRNVQRVYHIKSVHNDKN